MMMTPAESGAFIAARSKDVKIIDEGVDNCAKDIVQKIESGELEMTKLFIKTEVNIIDQ